VLLLFLLTTPFWGNCVESRGGGMPVWGIDIQLLDACVAPDRALQPVNDVNDLHPGIATVLAGLDQPEDNLVIRDPLYGQFLFF
jgi:hypothetical protein